LKEICNTYIQRGGQKKVFRNVKVEKLIFESIKTFGYLKKEKPHSAATLRGKTKITQYMKYRATMIITVM